MPDLDQLLRAVVDDARATQAPGASKAIARARRRRAAGTALAAVAIIAVGSSLAATTLAGRDGRSSIAASGRPSPKPSVFQEDAEVDGAAFRNQLRRALASAPGWSVSEGVDPTVLHPCAGNWSSGDTGGSGGTISLTALPRGPKIWSDGIGFYSEAQASQAVSLLVRNLETCTARSWSTARIGQTGAVLATSPDAVVWIHQMGSRVSTLQAPTTDGPPPVPVQVEVADLIASWLRSPR